MADKISTREAYGRALCKYGKDNADVVALEADLSTCTMSCYFQEACPERHFQMGIAEANMVAAAAGFASCGKIPFIHSFAVFTAGRCYDQVRNSVAYPGLNVKLIGSHAGITVGEDGPTHQCVEDISLMRTIPGMVVLSPCDANEADAAVKAMIEYKGPVYMRTGRTAREVVTTNFENYKFEIGKAVELVEGSDVAILATGIMVQESLKAAEMLKAEGISAAVVDFHTIKPLDKEKIIELAKRTGALVTAEEHNIIGGLGGAVAEVLAESCPTVLERVGVQDCFGHSGKFELLVEKYGLTPEAVCEKAKLAIARKAK